MESEIFARGVEYVIADEGVNDCGGFRCGFHGGGVCCGGCFGERGYVLHVVANAPEWAAARVVALWMVQRADVCWQLLRNCDLADVDAASYLSFQ